MIWAVGLDDNGWPQTATGGEGASFVQENGAINALPGSPFSTSTARGADNDYYFAGTYTTVIPGNGTYDPVGVVDIDEEAAERAFAAADNDLRYHFNLPATLKTNDLFTVTFDAFNLDTGAANTDPRYGIEVYVNGVKVQSEILIRPGQINTDYTTPQFTLAKVNARVGPGFDNIVSLRGINYNGEGGGNWMGIDFVRLEKADVAVPPAVFPWSVGKDDNGQPVVAGNAGGPDTSFVQENGAINPLPGSPTSTSVARGADNDYYFAGVYTNVVAANGTYTPVGTVLVNEEAAERAFAAADNDLRYHFNLPGTLSLTNLVTVTFDPISLDAPSAVNTDPRYGIEVYFNNVRVQPQIVIRPADLNKTYVTPQFTLASVNARLGPGTDNIVSLRGINYNAEGGGNWMGLDYVALNPVAPPIPAPTLPWSVGLNDNGQPITLNGGGINAAFVQENGAINPLPGSPTSTKVAQGADNDYYFAGVYTNVIAGNGTYTPVGRVQANEDSAERAFAAADNALRYHFNLPGTLATNDQLTVSFDALSLDTSGADPRYGIEVYFNNVLVQTQIVIRADQLNTGFSTPPFTASSVNAKAGPGFDNIVTLKGINYNADGGGNWMGIDFVELSQVFPTPFPWAVGKDDNAWPLGGIGGGPNTSFVQESGTNPLPGNPNNPQVDQRGDDDYYFAGTYTQPIPSVVAQQGDYEPAGTVLINEQVAERAFAGSDNTKRYHFNLPSTFKTNDLLLVTFDAFNLDTSGADPHYGIEIYFNDVLIQPEIVIYPPDLDKDFTTKPFSLASVNAKAGSGFDNIITLKGINYNADGGGNWMGIDYVQLNPIPAPVFPLAIGKEDNGWPILAGNTGGAEASFVQENGSINDLPGNPGSRTVAQGADNDYYFAGVYTNVIAGNGAYEPVGVVPLNEQAAERAFAAADNDLRYHFNLPTSLNPTDQLTVTFDAFNLDTGAANADPRYGIEVWFNGVKVQSEILIRTNQLDVDFTTPPFTLASVDAKVGLGFDNIVSLRGINYNTDGGGNWMGIDHVQINAANATPPKLNMPVLSAGKVTIDWTGTGTLESATSILGPWTAVTPASKPYVADVASARVRFYRLR